MEKRYFDNPYPDYQPTTRVNIDEKQIKTLIVEYVETIRNHTWPGSGYHDASSNLYVGNSGIAYMLWRLSRSDYTKHMFPALQYARTYIYHAKRLTEREGNRPKDRYNFILGRAGVYAVSTVINYDLHVNEELSTDLQEFRQGIPAALKSSRTETEYDEILYGRAGYLSGCYWLNDVTRSSLISDNEIISICNVIVERGRQYSRQKGSIMPLMYQCFDSEYLGAAHGLSGILHMLLDSPWFSRNKNLLPYDYVADIKRCVDLFVQLQDSWGNFPIGLEDLQRHQPKRIVQWCHGGPGAIYLLCKAYLIFREEVYINAARKAADLTWEQGVLTKGPGICHGVAGNGYAFLVLYRITGDSMHLYRAVKFMEILTLPDFRQKARIPDNPYSLYEGLAGTVCFLIDLLSPENAHFPFMEIFH